MLVSLLSDSEGDAKSPPQRPASTAGLLVYCIVCQHLYPCSLSGEVPTSPHITLLSAGINQKRSEFTGNQQFSSSLPKAAPNTSAPLQAAKPEPPSASTQPAHLASAAMQIFSDDDEDADLLIPLAFAAMPKPTPARHDHADLAPSNSGFDAAFGSKIADTVTLATQRVSGYELGCRDHTYATAEMGSEPLSAPK